MIEAKKHYCEFPHIKAGPDGDIVDVLICCKRAIGKYDDLWLCPEHLAMLDPKFAAKK